MSQHNDSMLECGACAECRERYAKNHPAVKELIAAARVCEKHRFGPKSTDEMFDTLRTALQNLEKK